MSGVKGKRIAATEIKVPDIGTDEVEIIEILVRVGDKVEVEQSLITVGGDKVSMEISSPQAGIVKEIEAFVGDKTQTGVLAMTFNSTDGAADAVPVQAEGRKEAVPTATPAAAAARDVNVPDIGSGEAEVIEILVKVGDKIEAEQSLITVKGDKASMEVLAPFTGTVKEIKVDVGDKVSIGSLIMVSEVAGEAGAVVPAVKQEAAPAATPAPAANVREVSIPDISGDEVEVTEVIVRVDDKVAAEQSLVTIEDNEASMEVSAPFAGVMRELKANVDDKAKTGSLIMVSEVEGAAPAATPTKQEAAVSVPAVRAEAPTAAPVTKTEGRSEFVENDIYVHTTPLIRRPTREFGVNLAKVEGTGRKGRILREDAQAYVKETIKCAEVAPTAAGGGIPDMLSQLKVDFSKLGEIEEVEPGRIQKISGANLSRNWVMIPHVTHFDKTDITELEAFRKQQNEEAAKRKLDVKITPVVLIMKVVAAALKQMPRFNSSLLEGGQRLILKKYINTGAAMDTPNGLVVPVFKDVSKKGITELFHGLMAISKKVCDGKPTVGGMQGGCFTISSIDGLGTTRFAPIVNAPEVVALGISKSAMKSVWNGKKFVSRLMLPISFSFDHHVIDDADGARFITIINNTLLGIRHLMM